MKIFANIENDGYWVPGGTYYVDVWEVSHSSTFADGTCDSGIRGRGSVTHSLRADEEIISGAEGVWGANGEYTEEVPPVYDFETSEATLDDWLGNLTLVSSETLKEGNNCKLVRYIFEVWEDAEESDAYLKMGSNQFSACIEV